MEIGIIQNTTSVLLQLLAVYEVQETETAEVFRIDLTLINMDGEEVRTWYHSYPDDTFGLNPVIRQWFADNPSFPRTPYTPPTPEEIRTSMLPLTRVKFRLALSKNGLKASNVQALIDSIEDPDEMEEMQIIWDDEQSFSRLSAFVVNVIGSARTPEQIDTLWSAAIET